MDTRLKGKRGTQQPEINDDERPLGDTQTTASKQANAMPGEEKVDLDLILRELRGFRQDNKQQLEDIKGEISKTNVRLDEAEERIMKVEERVQNTEDILAEMLKLHNSLDAKITDQENRSRRENIRLYGVTEGAEKQSQSMTSFVEKLLRENLDIPDDMPLHLERAHRALGPQPPEDAAPRSILVRFLSSKTKENVLRLAWQKKGFTWQGRRINLDNDYAPRTLQKRRAYTEIRKILKERQIPFQTLYPARLKVKYNDETQIYESAEEAATDMSDRGYPVEIARPPETLMDKLRQLTWERNSQRRGRRASHPRRESNFKERLQSFRRASPPTTSS